MKRFFLMFGVALLFVVFLVMLNAFYAAYFSSAKAVTIYINNFKEANIEAWLIMPGILIFGAISLILSIKEFYKR